MRLNNGSSSGLGIGGRIAAQFGALLLSAIAALLAVWFYGLPPVGIQGARDIKLAEAFHAIEVSADSRQNQIDTMITERRGDTRLLSRSPVLEHLLGQIDANRTNATHALRDTAERMFADVLLAYPAQNESRT